MALSPLTAIPPRTSAGNRERNAPVPATKDAKSANTLAHNQGPSWKMQTKPRQNGPMIQRQTKNVNQSPKPKEKPRRAGGDRIRESPEKGIEINGGTLFWKLEFVEDKSSATPSKKEGGAPNIINIATAPPDVRIKARFVSRGKTTCPTYTFVQTVKPTVGTTTPDYAYPHLLYTRDATSGASIDSVDGEVEPFYTAERKADHKGWQGEIDSAKTKSRYKLAGKKEGKEATFEDAPKLSRRDIIKGQISRREFELAVLCIETGKTQGALKWGYTKTKDGLVTLTGAQVVDVNKSSASTEFERTRLKFYDGIFQHSFHSFSRGSDRLKGTHRKELDRLARYGQVRDILLIGANDNSGGRENSPTLALKRAEAVRDYLISKNVPSAKIKTLGHGVHARYPNPPGRRVPQNRRVDMKINWGVQSNNKNAIPGSPMESMLIKRLDPRATLREVTSNISRLIQTKGPIPLAECNTLRFQIHALERWRKRDRTIPNVEQIYHSQLRSIFSRCKSIINQKPNEVLEKIRKNYPQEDRLERPETDDSYPMPLVSK